MTCRWCTPEEHRKLYLKEVKAFDYFLEYSKHGSIYDRVMNPERYRRISPNA